MKTEYLVVFIDWLGREHNIDLTREEQSDYEDGESTIHYIDDNTVERLAKQYCHFVINTGEI